MQSIHIIEIDDKYTASMFFCFGENFKSFQTKTNENKLLQDFEGQGRAEKLSRIIITLFGIVGLVWGGIVQQFSQTIFILAAGVLLTLIVSNQFKMSHLRIHREILIVRFLEYFHGGKTKIVICGSIQAFG